MTSELCEVGTLLNLSELQFIIIICGNGENYSN